MPLPVASGRVTQVFGPTNERLDSGGVNKGLDVSVPTGTTVLSTTGGTVVNAGDAGDGWGTSVKIRDAQGNIHNYGHLSGANVQVGQTVEQGQAIGRSGNTGASTGPHLSYDVKGANGQYVDPSPWLGFDAAGDNRQGHPAIGQDVSELGSTAQASGSPAGGSSGAAAGTPLTDENGNTMYYTDPEINSQFLDLRDRASQATQAWIESGQQAYSDEYYAMVEAMDALDQFQVVYQNFAVESQNGEDPAQQAFDNSIRLGDLNLREADSAFNRWLQKTESARAAAVNERDQRAGYNQELVERQEARNQSSTPGLIPRARNAGYIEQPFEQLLNKYQEQYGVEDKFDPGSVDYTQPGDLPGTGAGQQQPAQTPNAVSPDDTTHTPPVGHPAGAPATVGPKGNVPAAGHPASTQPSATPNTPPLEHPAMAGPSNPPDTPWWKQPGKDIASDVGSGAVTGLDDFAGGAILGTMTPFGPLLGGAANTASGGAITDAAVSGAKKAGGAVKHWWQRGFAEGGIGIKGGPAWVGEKGPEIMEVPGFGRKVVGQMGPEQVQVPEGANIIPLEEAMAFQQIQQAAQQDAQRQNPQQKQAEMQARANDPNLEQKVREAIRKAFASEAATDPPFTPILEDPRIKDYWAPWRELSGVPAYAEEAMAMQEEAQKGQRGGGGGQRQQAQAAQPAQRGQ